MMLALDSYDSAKRAMRRLLWQSVNTLRETATMAGEMANASSEMLLNMIPSILRPELAQSLDTPRLVSAVCGFPKFNGACDDYKRGQYGEDAWFKTETKTADILGVADGVGGWRLYGIDPGQFSSFLMRSCERLAHANTFDPTQPIKLLAQGFCDLLEQKHPVLGSSTACLLSFQRESRMLYAANIGDSGFMVIREGCIVCRSNEQQHCFNTPYQLSAPPPGNNVVVLADKPESADTFQFQLKTGDIIMLATDGVFDNVTETQMLYVLNELSGVKDPIKLQMAANCLALMARTMSFNTEIESPFTVNARRNNIEALGGKPDDITVMLAAFVDDEVKTT